MKREGEKRRRIKGTERRVGRGRRGREEEKRSGKRRGRERERLKPRMGHAGPSLGKNRAARAHHHASRAGEYCSVVFSATSAASSAALFMISLAILLSFVCFHPRRGRLPNRAGGEALRQSEEWCHMI